jgi:hypothetical protein
VLKLGNNIFNFQDAGKPTVPKTTIPPIPTQPASTTVDPMKFPEAPNDGGKVE